MSSLVWKHYAPGVIVAGAVNPWHGHGYTVHIVGGTSTTVPDIDAVRTLLADTVPGAVISGTTVYAGDTVAGYVISESWWAGHHPCACAACRYRRHYCGLCDGTATHPLGGHPTATAGSR